MHSITILKQFFFFSCIREAAKKVLLLMAGPLRPKPPPLELNGHWKVGMLEKKVKKSYFFLDGLALYHPIPLNGTAIKRRTFAASLILYCFLINCPNQYSCLATSNKKMTRLLSVINFNLTKTLFSQN